MCKYAIFIFTFYSDLHIRVDTLIHLIDNKLNKFHSSSTSHAYYYIEKRLN